MLFYIWNLWRFYNYLVAIHGFYVAYSVFMWSYSNISYMCSLFITHPNEIKQICDKPK